MSLSRTALRLATMEALAPSAAVLANTGPWPTLATKYVYDSAIDPIEDLQPTERRPIAVIYTEDDAGEGGQKAGGPPFKRIVDLVIELSVAVMLPDGDVFVAGLPITDGELESSLDLFEGQVLFALMIGPTGMLWRSLTARRVSETHSVPKRTGEEGIRLAMRTLRLKTQIPDDVYPAAPESAPVGNDALPEPLKTVIAALAAGSYGMPVMTPLNTVTLDLQPGSASAPHDAAKPQINATADDLQS